MKFLVLGASDQNRKKGSIFPVLPRSRGIQGSIYDASSGCHLKTMTSRMRGQIGPLHPAMTDGTADPAGGCATTPGSPDRMASENATARQPGAHAACCEQRARGSSRECAKRRFARSAQRQCPKTEAYASSSASIPVPLPFHLPLRLTPSLSRPPSLSPCFPSPSFCASLLCAHQNNVCANSS